MASGHTYKTLYPLVLIKCSNSIYSAYKLLMKKKLISRITSTPLFRGIRAQRTVWVYDDIAIEMASAHFI